MVDCKQEKGYSQSSAGAASEHKGLNAGLGHSRWRITRGTSLFYKHIAQLIPCWPFPEVPSWLAGWLAPALSGPNHFSSQNDQILQLR